MASFYVVDKEREAQIPFKEDPSDRLIPTPHGFQVWSASIPQKRIMAIFDQFEPAAEYFERASNPLKDDIVRLWKVSAWTQKGAAKQCMKMAGVVVRLAKSEDIAKRDKDRKIGNILLYAMENTDLSDDQINELHKELKTAIPEHK